MKDQSTSRTPELVAVLMRRHARGFVISMPADEGVFYGPDQQVPLPRGLSDDDRLQAEWWRARWARGAAPGP